MLDLEELESFIRLCLAGPSEELAQVTESTLAAILEAGTSALLEQPSLLTLAAPATVFGDIYGNLRALVRLFAMVGFPPASCWIFLGNYATRGHHGIECIAFLLALQLRYPGRVFLLRGNHDCAAVSRMYGLSRRCRTRGYSDQLFATQLTAAFDALPLAAIVGDCIFCVHGGLGPALLERGLDAVSALQRPLSVPQSGLVVDLLWACPSDALGWGCDARNSSVTTFGVDTLGEFCERNRVQLVVRGLQVVADGFMRWPDKRVVTVFSCPNFGNDFDNAAAALCFDAKMRITVKQLRFTRPEALTRTAGTLTLTSGVTTAPSAPSAPSKDSTPPSGPAKVSGYL